MRASFQAFVQQYPWLCLGLLFVFLFGFQLLNILFGIDVYDTGFHLVAYENVFDAPDSVSYNFMYYLTNIVGGAVLRMFPSMGIMDFCFVGSFCVLATMAFIYALLKNELPIVHLLLGFVLVIISYVRLPYSLNNGIISCCLYAMSFVLLYKGLKKENILLLMLSGMVVGLNIFTRIPNILGVGVVLVVLLHKKYYYNRNGLDWKSAGLFMLGVLIGICIVFLLMIKLGHLGIFIRSMRVVFFMAGGNGAHSLLWILKIYIAFYLSAIIPLLVIYAFCHIEKVLDERGNPHFKIAFYIIAVLSGFLCIYEYLWVYKLLWGVFVLGCTLCLLKHRGESVGLLAFLALFMLVFEVYGSDSCVNHGSLPALLAAPIASSQLLNKKRMVYVLIFFFAVCWQIIRRGNHLDYGPIYQKTEHLSCYEARHLFTSVEKANAINSTLEGIQPYVNSGDTLMCFPCAPMMNYLTHTRPAGGMCWIGVDGNFVQPIDYTPKILFNKTSLAGKSWVEEFTMEGKYEYDIKAFIIENQYRKVYENQYFILFVP